MENWKHIKGFENRYLISDKGKALSLINSEGNVRFPPKLLKCSKERKGYLQLALWKDKACKKMKVHRLVLNAFVGESDLDVHHINGIRDDNRLENLIWVTVSENNRLARIVRQTNKERKVLSNHPQ